MFGLRIPYQFTFKKYCRYLCSYFVVILICLVVIFNTGLLLKWKADTLKYNAANKIDNYKPLMIGALVPCQIKFMSVIYSFIAVWLTNFENHERRSWYDGSLSIKIIFFEFINNYSALYYIAFLKGPYGEGCQDNNCFGELTIQLYIILVVSFFFNIVELGKPFFMDWLAKRTLREKYNKPLDFSPHSIYHQIVSEEYGSVRDDYNEMIIQFGYLMFFSVAAPLTPLICLILTYTEKFVDTYKNFLSSKSYHNKWCEWNRNI